MKRIAATTATLLFLSVPFAGAMAAGPASHQNTAYDHGGSQMMDNSGRDTKALNMLEANGYTRFSNFRSDGKNFEATVTANNGKQMTVIVDPDSGHITRQG